MRNGARARKIKDVGTKVCGFMPQRDGIEHGLCPCAQRNFGGINSIREISEYVWGTATLPDRLHGNRNKVEGADGQKGWSVAKGNPYGSQRSGLMTENRPCENKFHFRCFSPNPHKFPGCKFSRPSPPAGSAAYACHSPECSASRGGLPLD